MREVAETCQLDLFALGRVYNRLKRMYGLRVPPLDPGAYVARAAGAIPELLAGAQQSGRAANGGAGGGGGGERDGVGMGLSGRGGGGGDSGWEIRGGGSEGLALLGAAAAGAHPGRDGGGRLQGVGISTTPTRFVVPTFERERDLSRAASLAPLVNDAKSILAFAHSRGLTTGRQPVSLVAAALVVAAQARGICLSYKQVAAAARASPESTRRTHIVLNQELLSFLHTYEWGKAATLRSFNAFLPMLVTHLAGAQHEQQRREQEQCDREQRQGESSEWRQEQQRLGKTGLAREDTRLAPAAGAGKRSAAGGGSSTTGMHEKQAAVAEELVKTASEASVLDARFNAMPPSFRVKEAQRIKRSRHIADAREGTIAAFSAAWGGTPAAASPVEEGTATDVQHAASAGRGGGAGGAAVMAMEGTPAAEAGTKLAAVATVTVTMPATATSPPWVPPLTSNKRAPGLKRISRGGVKRSRGKRVQGWDIPVEPSPASVLTYADAPWGMKAPFHSLPTPLSWPSPLLPKPPPPSAVTDEDIHFSHGQAGSAPFRDIGWSDVMLQQLMLMGVPERFLLEEEGLYSGGGGERWEDWEGVGEGAGVKAGGCKGGGKHKGASSDVSTEGAKAAATAAAKRVVERYRNETSRDPLLSTGIGGPLSEEAVEKADAAAIAAIPDAEVVPMLRTPAEAAMMKAMLSSSFGGEVQFYPLAARGQGGEDGNGDDSDDGCGGLRRETDEAIPGWDI